MLSLLLPLALLACSDEPAERSDPVGDGGGGPAPAVAAGDAGAPAGPDAADAAEDAPAPDAPATIGFEDAQRVPDSELANYHVEMEVAIDGESVGTLVLELWPQHAPITVRNFLRLCDEGFYTGLGFHRVLRSFMVQGGDPTGTGGGNSPYGTIRGEFSDDPERAHGYGVLSMARVGGADDSASCQFFICNDEGINVWSLDGKYASFGRLVGGVAALEALSDVPVGPSPTGEPSRPLGKLTILGTTVRAGAAPAPTEEIARPLVPVDLAGEPERIAVQDCVISFQGRARGATRSQEEAEALALQLLEQARGGADFSALVREHSDEAREPEAERPGLYQLLNSGLRDIAGERALFVQQRALQDELDGMRTRLNAGTLTREEYQARSRAIAQEFQWFARTRAFLERGRVTRGLGDVGFRLAVGEVGLVNFDAQAAPDGWHIIKRLE
jgi:peptidyl-prolyl cis-trans isomerase B (cyclophilin B)